MAKRVFTLQEANRFIPWLEDEFKKLDTLREEEARLHDRVFSLLRQSRGNGKSGMEEDIAEAHKAVEDVKSGITGAVQEISGQGIIVRDLNSGLVDFLSMRGGEEVFLCWIRGEDAIEYWHGVHEGYLSRKPL